MNTPSILLLGKHNDFCCERAAEFVKRHFPNHCVRLGRRGDRFPENVDVQHPDYIISYLSPWIIPAAVLGQARSAALNFHPGPPEYPGIGCTNFAIYNEEKRFGITCHHMEPAVDTGPIVAVKRFSLFATDSVYSLTQRCYAHILDLFLEIMSGILEGHSLPETTETWWRRPYRRSELEALCRISPEMPREEILRRIRATTFPGAPGPYLEVQGIGFRTLDVADARSAA